MKVGELIYKIILEGQQAFNKAVDESKKQINNLGDATKKADAGFLKMQNSIKGFWSQLTSAKSLIQGFLTGVVVRGIGNLLKLGAELNSLEGAFSRLAGSIGLDSKEVLGSLQELSAGTISNKDLILSANRAIVLGVAKDMDEFGVLMQTARIRAQEMGISTTQAFNDIVTGIGRSSPLILDNLGIVIKQQEAYDRYAESLGKTSKELTVNEQREALKFSVLEDGRRQIEALGEIQLTYADRIAQATTATQNFQANLGKALLPAMASVLEQFNLGNEAIGNNSRGWDNLSRTVFKATNFIIGMGKALGLIVQGLTGVGDVLFSFAKNAVAPFKALGQAIKGDFGEAYDTLKNSSSDSFNEAISKAKAYKDILSDTWASIGENALNAFDDSRFEEATKGVAQGYANMSSESEELTQNIEESGASSEKLTASLEKMQEQAMKTSQTFQNDLNKSIKEFNDEIIGTFQETNAELADIALNAEERIKQLREQLSSSTGDTSSIRDEISQYEAILDAREGYEERQAEKIAEIRTKLEEAGIDATQAGLDKLLETRSLEEEIEEKRRIASLDEFTRFEEQQFKKIDLLVDTFLQETTLLNEKIAKQKSLEQELTDVIINQNKIRQAQVDSFVSHALSKYGELAGFMQSLLSDSARISNLTSPIQPVSTNTITNTISPTINVQNSSKMNEGELATKLSREITRRIV